MKYAVVTIAVGNSYLAYYSRIFRKNTEEYCKKYGYDFVLITDYALPAKYPINPFVNIMKWTLPYREDLQQYERILILDADILLTSNCPPFHMIELNGKIGTVDEYSQPTPSMRIDIQKACGYETSATEYYYKHTGLTLNTTHVLNGGLYICSPLLHGPFFKSIFEAHVDGTFTCRTNPLHYEQGMFGYELQTKNMYTLLDNSWNQIWPIISHQIHIGNRDRTDYGKELFTKVYAIHFCGRKDWDIAFTLSNLGIKEFCNIEVICNVAAEANRLSTLQPLLQHYNVIPGYTTYGEDTKSHPYYSKFISKLNATSLTINHIVLMEKYQDSKLPLLIFESDVIGLYDFSTIDTKLKEIIQNMTLHNIDFVFLGKGCFDSVNPNNYKQIANDLYKSETSRCTESYIIGPKGIRAYLDYFYTTDKHIVIDANLNLFFKSRPDIVCCWTIPELFKQGSFSGMYPSLVPQ